ncbi:MAG: response regulator [Bacteroidetes bacterium]|nr:response regulator [Bacteroidota bacterium]
MRYDFDILVIDDESVVVGAVSKICKYNNFTIDTANDGSIALEKVKKFHYRVIICDIMMPEIDGFQFLDEFWKENKLTPIIVTSGFSTNENAVKALTNGAFDFLAKPFSFDELSSTINRAMRYHKSSKIDNNISIANLSHPLYVACPSAYYRLGYLSWAKNERDGTALLGIINLYYEFIGTPAELILLSVESKVYQGSTLLTIISDDSSEHVVPSPLSGTIVEVNENVNQNYNLIGKDPYFGGWLYKIIPSDIEEELKQLVPCSSDRV